MRATRIEIGQPASPMISRVMPRSVARMPEITRMISAAKSMMFSAAMSKVIIVSRYYAVICGLGLSSYTAHDLDQLGKGGRLRQ